MTTDTNTSFKEELEQILKGYHDRLLMTETAYDIKQRNTALTSIINLVDKVIGEDEERKVEDWDCLCGTNHHLETDYHQRNALRAKQRAIIRNSDEHTNM